MADRVDISVSGVQPGGTGGTSGFQLGEGNVELGDLWSALESWDGRLGFEDPRAELESLAIAQAAAGGDQTAQLRAATAAYDQQQALISRYQAFRRQFPGLPASQFPGSGQLPLDQNGNVITSALLPPPPVLQPGTVAVAPAPVAILPVSSLPPPGVPASVPTPAPVDLAGATPGVRQAPVPFGGNPIAADDQEATWATAEPTPAAPPRPAGPVNPNRPTARPRTIPTPTPAPAPPPAPPGLPAIAPDAEVLAGGAIAELETAVDAGEVLEVLAHEDPVGLVGDDLPDITPAGRPLDQIGLPLPEAEGMSTIFDSGIVPDASEHPSDTIDNVIGAFQPPDDVVEPSVIPDADISKLPESVSAIGVTAGLIGQPGVEAPPVTTISGDEDVSLSGDPMFPTFDEELPDASGTLDTELDFIGGDSMAFEDDLNNLDTSGNDASFGLDDLRDLVDTAREIKEDTDTIFRTPPREQGPAPMTISMPVLVGALVVLYFLTRK